MTYKHLLLLIIPIVTTFTGYLYGKVELYERDDHQQICYLETDSKLMEMME